MNNIEYQHFKHHPPPLKENQHPHFTAIFVTKSPKVRHNFVTNSHQDNVLLFS